MASLGGALATTMRPWRSLYACACCCLLPLSTAPRPATTATRTAGFVRAAACAARYSGRNCNGSSSSGPRRPSNGLAAGARPTSTLWSVAGTTANSPASAARWQQQPQLQHQRRPRGMMLFAGGGCGATCGGGAGYSPLMNRSGGGSRPLSLSRPPKIRGRARRGAGGGGVLRMGKGLDRKKAKKELVRAEIEARLQQAAVDDAQSEWNC